VRGGSSALARGRVATGRLGRSDAAAGAARRAPRRCSVDPFTEAAWGDSVVAASGAT
jgi:hypothetical protein